MTRDGEQRRHCILLALGLFVLAPFVGEYLLGNQPIDQLPAIIVLAPMYGGGALLVRESARRTGRGWPTMVMLAAAYALVEEGLIDQMIFDPGYLGLPSFQGWGPIPGLGASAVLIEGSLALHTVWSICVPIALMEAFDPRPSEPWLRRPGLVVVGLVFLSGSLLLAVFQAVDLDFVASPLQLTVCTAAIVALVVAAFRLRALPPPFTAPRPAPTPLAAVALAFLCTGVYWGQSVFAPDALSEWATVAFWFVPVAVGAGVRSAGLVGRGGARGIASGSPPVRCSPMSGSASPRPESWTASHRIERLWATWSSGRPRWWCWRWPAVRFGGTRGTGRHR